MYMPTTDGRAHAECQTRADVYMVRTRIPADSAEKLVPRIGLSVDFLISVKH